MFLILKPLPTSLPISSLWVTPVHQPQASCILHQTWTGNLFLIWYYTCFNAILPNHPLPPSPTESKRLFYTSVSLLLSRIQGYHYQLSKFHIYVLVYCIGVFLSGLLPGVQVPFSYFTQRNLPGTEKGRGPAPVMAAESGDCNRAVKSFIKHDQKNIFIDTFTSHFPT